MSNRTIDEILLDEGYDEQDVDEFMHEHYENLEGMDYNLRKFRESVEKSTLLYCVECGDEIDDDITNPVRICEECENDE